MATGALVWVAAASGSASAPRTAVASDAPELVVAAVTRLRGSKHALAALLECGDVLPLWDSGQGPRLDAFVADVAALLRAQPELGTRVVDLAVGERHYLALTERGAVLSGGENEHGQLGLAHTRPVAGAALIKTLAGRDVVSIQCGSFHSLALTRCGDVYAWGRALDGETGTGAEVALLPRFVSKLHGTAVAEIACSGSFSAARTSDGRVFAWGALNREPRRLPVLVPLPPGCGAAARITCGWGHLAVLTSEGRLLACGMGSHGQLGTGGVRSDELVDVDGARRFSAVWAEGSSTVALAADGEGLVGWGAAFASPLRSVPLRGQPPRELALCQGRLAAFVPLHVRSVWPRAVSAAGGTPVTLSLGGVSPAARWCAVRVDTRETTFSARADIAGDGTAVFVCEKLDRFAKPGDVPSARVVVSLDSAHWSDAAALPLFAPPVAATCSPAIGPAEGGTNCSLALALTRGVEYPPVAVRVARGAVSAETAAELDSEMQCVRFIMPPLPDAAADAGARPTPATIAVRLDGAQWTPLGELFTPYSLKTLSLSPARVSLAAEETKLALRVTGVLRGDALQMRISNERKTAVVPAFFTSTLASKRAERQARSHLLAKLLVEREARARAEAERRERETAEAAAAAAAAAAAEEEKKKDPKAKRATMKKETRPPSSEKKGAVAQQQSSASMPAEAAAAQQQRENEDEKTIALLQRAEAEYAETEADSLSGLLHASARLAEWGAGPLSLALSNNGVDFSPCGFQMFVDAPTPLRIAPSCASVAGGTRVTVLGTGFFDCGPVEAQLVQGAAPAVVPALWTQESETTLRTLLSRRAARPLLEGPEPKPVDAAAPLSLVCAVLTLPATGASGAASIEWPSQQVAGAPPTAATRFDIFLYDEPVLSALAPASVPATGGASVAISGAGLVDSADARVRLVVAVGEGKDKTERVLEAGPASFAPTPADATKPKGASKAAKKPSDAAAPAPPPLNEGSYSFTVPDLSALEVGEARVELALDGQHFVAAPKPLKLERAAKSRSK